MNEYKVEDHQEIVSEDMDKGFLDDYAREGWQLVFVVTYKQRWHGEKQQNFRFYFVREKQDE